MRHNNILSLVLQYKTGISSPIGRTRMIQNRKDHGAISVRHLPLLDTAHLSLLLVRQLHHVKLWFNTCCRPIDQEVLSTSYCLVIVSWTLIHLGTKINQISSSEAQ
eukprot:scaffold189408_cov38-Prasinocladus_malaysianus.AAC.1